MPAEKIVERLQWLLDGRSPWKWGERLLLSPGTVGRMLKGSLPDPEKLVPAVHLENISLTWLVAGIGSPYVVATPTTDQVAADLLRTMLRDEPESVVLVAYCNLGFCPVVHTQVIVEREGKRYAYRQTTIIGGGVCGRLCREVLDRFAWSTQRDRGSGPYLAISQLCLQTQDWVALATGFMGNHKLFGEGIIGGLALEGDPYQGVAGLGQDRPMVHEPVMPESFSPELDEVIKTWRRLSSPDRLAALRMLRGLATPT